MTTTKLNELLDAVEYVEAMAGRLRTELNISWMTSAPLLSNGRLAKTPGEITTFAKCIKLRRLCKQCLSSEDLHEVVICRAECIERVLEELESLDPNLFENYGDEETCLTFVEALKEVKADARDN